MTTPLHCLSWRQSRHIMPLALLMGLALLPQSGLAQVDLNGTWMPSLRETVGFPRANQPYTPKGQAMQDAFRAEFDPDRDDPAFFCVQPGMPMSLAPAAPFPVEIIQREHDITMFFEAYSVYRKIYMEGYPRPDPILHTLSGYSVGHWEGDTLVVNTTHMAERPLGRILTTENAVLTERISLELDSDGQRRLIADMVFRDPELYSQDLIIKGVWVESPDTPIMEYVCTDEIYEQHLERVRAARN